MDIKKQFSKEIEEYRKIRRECVCAQMKYDDVKVTAENRNSNALKANLQKVISKENLFKEEYAKKVFNILIKEKPVLIRRRDKVLVPWEDAFGLEYSLLSDGLKSSLIALVEEVGGQYRLYK